MDEVTGKMIDDSCLTNYLHWIRTVEKKTEELEQDAHYESRHIKKLEQRMGEMEQELVKLVKNLNSFFKDEVEVQFNNSLRELALKIVKLEETHVQARTLSVEEVERANKLLKDIEAATSWCGPGIMNSRGHYRPAQRGEEAGLWAMHPHCGLKTENES